ncbi:MAG: 3-oxoacyl-ACP reductase FabG [Candidatus Hodarchaeales archaeon]
MKLKNKVALITGAGRGIGYETAVEFLSEGAKVIIVDKSIESWSASDQNDSSFYAKEIDITNFDQVRGFVGKIKEKFGQIDILVNNAGVNRDGLFVKMTEDQWDTVFTVNLKSTFVLTQEICKLMIKTKNKGKVINIVSTSGKHGNFGQANYAASKAGLMAFTKSVAREMGRYGITVNAVMPGLIDTPMTQALSSDIKEKRIKEIPLRRIGKPKEVARAIVFLASEDASYITGSVIQVDGGLRM